MLDASNEFMSMLGEHINWILALSLANKTNPLSI